MHSGHLRQSPAQNDCNWIKGIRICDKIETLMVNCQTKQNQVKGEVFHHNVQYIPGILLICLTEFGRLPEAFTVFKTWRNVGICRLISRMSLVSFEFSYALFARIPDIFLEKFWTFLIGGGGGGAPAPSSSGLYAYALTKCTIWYIITFQGGLLNILCI